MIPATHLLKDFGFSPQKLRSWINAGIVGDPVKGKFTEESYFRLDYAVYLQTKYKIKSLLDLVVKVDDMSELFASESPIFFLCEQEIKKYKVKKLKKKKSKKRKIQIEFDME